VTLLAFAAECRAAAPLLVGPSPARTTIISKPAAHAAAAVE